VHVRVTGVVIEEDRILLLNQDTDTGRSWSLPGGKVEEGEPLATALVREMRKRPAWTSSRAACCTSVIICPATGRTWFT